ncbi:MAG: cytochrome c3 family protein [Verrucomicrobiota bacterium]
MAQLFTPRSNSIAKALIVVMLLLVSVVTAGTWKVWWSPYMTREGMPLDQPVPFSHKHHVSGLGIDCRYCHVSVENSAFAGIPPTETCMTCHSQVWTDAPVLEPVRQSWTTHTPIEWNRVHKVPDFVFFNHGIHIQKGIGCSTCHGAVQQMPLTQKEHSFYMKWCLECHQDPAKYVRPKSEVFNMEYQTPRNQAELGAKLVREYHIDTTQLRDCSMCHR